MQRICTVDPAAAKAVVAALLAILVGIGLSRFAYSPGLATPVHVFDEALLAAVLETKPAVVSIHFGLPAPEANRHFGRPEIRSSRTPPPSLKLACSRNAEPTRSSRKASRPEDTGARSSMASRGRRSD